MINRNSLQPTPAVILADIQVCTGDVCTIEQGRGTTKNARDEVFKMLDNLKTHAYYLHINRIGNEDISTLSTNQIVKIIRRSKIKTEILEYEIRYITPERYSIERRGNKEIIRNERTGEVISSVNRKRYGKAVDVRGYLDTFKERGDEQMKIRKSYKGKQLKNNMENIEQLEYEELTKEDFEAMKEYIKKQRGKQ